MENLSKKVNWAIGLSVVALILVAIMFVLWCCNAGGFSAVSLDTFVGVIVALLAIIVTLVLGWQIFNIFELRQKMEEMNELKSQFNEQSKKIEKLSLRSEHAMYLTWGDKEFDKQNYWLATYYYIISLKHALAMSSTTNISKIKKALEHSKPKINKIKEKCKISPWAMAKIKCADKEIRKSTAYCCMKDFYDNIYKIFIEHTIVDDEQK